MGTSWCVPVCPCAGGWLPPLWGSGLYRSTQFAVYEALYTKWDANRAQPAGVAGRAPGALAPRNHNTVIPFTGGLETRVLQAAWCASLARAIIECPIEYAKVARQTGQGWGLKQVYTGFGLQWFVTPATATATAAAATAGIIASREGVLRTRIYSALGRSLTPTVIHLAACVAVCVCRVLCARAGFALGA